VEVEARGQRTLLSAGDALRVSRGDPLASAVGRAAELDEPPARPSSPGPAPDDPGSTSARGGAAARAGSDGEGSTARPVRSASGEAPRDGSGEGRSRPERSAGGQPPRRGAGGARPSGVAEEEAEQGASEESAASLLARADGHRRAGRTTEAMEALERLLAEHPDDPRAASAAFTLGRLEQRRGRHARAAAAFARSRGAAPSGPLAEDALAQEATSWAAAGERARAREAAGRYLALHPDGLHAPRMRALVE
jgi:TolA-binding protein